MGRGASGVRCTQMRERRREEKGTRQRDISASMSACMRCLYSSDHCAPGFWLDLLCGRGMEGVLLSRGDFRVPALSLRVTRGVDGFEEEFE
jgi:hypothetical protein